jgi:hypothetical protein
MFCLEYKTKHPAKHPPTTQAVFVLGLQPFGFPLPALKASFPPKGRRNLVSNIHQHFCPFFKKPEQSATPKEDIPSCAERLLPFGFALL